MSVPGLYEDAVRQVVRGHMAQLGADEFATDYLTGIVTDHLLHCPEFKHGWGCKLGLFWVWKLPAAAQIPRDVLRQWRAHTGDYMASAVAGDASALAELRRRRGDCQTSFCSTACEGKLREALLLRAKAGDEAALAELEQEVISSFTIEPVPRSPYAWTRALAEVSPDRAMALLEEATRGKPSPLRRANARRRVSHPRGLPSVLATRARALRPPRHPGEGDAIASASEGQRPTRYWRLPGMFAHATRLRT